MDAPHFDELTKSLATRTSRRQVLKVLASIAVGPKDGE
jgi:hypothetical protein